MSLPHEKYLSHDYIQSNPTWDCEDGPWKAAYVYNILHKIKYIPSSICEVGCGSGRVLSELRCVYPEAMLFGYDIAPAAATFWKNYENMGIHFRIGDFFDLNDRDYDLLLLLDVLEHVENPFSFLTKLQGLAQYYLFHFPLDLSAINILRETPILTQRKNVGHIHYFTKNLAISLLEECGYELLYWQYSGAAFNSPHRTIKTSLASVFRRLMYFIHKDLGVRAFGGETLFVLAKERALNR
jgi:hypothetical protein